MSQAALWKTPDHEYDPEFENGDEVLIAISPKGVPAKLTVFERRLNKDRDCYEYKLADKEGTVYKEQQGREEILWFDEDRLEVA